MLTLEQICSKLLVKYKSCLGDVGEMPMHLLCNVLDACNAEDLLRIETDTRAGGRTISADLAPYWEKVYLEVFGHCTSRPDDWKGAYLAKQRELDEKTARVGKKVKGMWDEARRKKDMRRIQVIDKIPQGRVKRARVDGANSPPDGVRQRLAKKLRINPVIIKSLPTYKSPPAKAVPGGLVEDDIMWN